MAGRDKIMTLAEFKQAFIVSETPEINDRGAQVWRGHSLGDVYYVGSHIPTTFHEREAFRDGRFRSVWISTTHLATITYCEGDICLVLCEEVWIFGREIAHAEAFYKEH